MIAWSDIEPLDELATKGKPKEALARVVLEGEGEGESEERGRRARRGGGAAVRTHAKTYRAGP